ncbi:serine/threonine protein kinase [Myxococcus stipitatus DSM 14675]|uniref:Serine/threonine protein kinase n=1 Tax=Myxococcus stipitatus (strain DSM 14675 / JCM 12634 / Mx s8) TaxID=1278073 RepID=L7TY00_MYXSD|nr:serine/threonine-protein kinase [Myxococcus stipitatus]AGC41401.1 serine/threonine protein kinase [Myxococcus stipitatus DSM 14675]
MHVGKYQLIRKLATGGMAEVFLAKAEGPGGFEKTLVLKRILPHLVEDPSFVEMFLEEAKLVAQLNHPNVVQIFDFGESEGTFFLAMELIDGPNLRRWRRQADSRGVFLPPNLCAKVVAHAAEGLAFAHDFEDAITGQPLGLIHRDVSPDNILVSRQGAVKVVDFGIAKVVGQKHRTQTGIVKGKVAYMPPEQVRADPLDRRVDVYALGVVLYELLTGRLPFEGASELAMMQAIISREPVPVTHLREDVPNALQSILAVALRKNREDRYPDCRALQADLERFVLSTGESVGAYQIARAVSQVVDEHLVPTPVSMRAMDSAPERTTPLGPVSKGAAAPTDVSDQPTEQRPSAARRGVRARRLPLVVGGAALVASAGAFVLVGGGKTPPAPRAHGDVVVRAAPVAKVEEAPRPAVPTEQVAPVAKVEPVAAPTVEKPQVQHAEASDSGKPEDVVPVVAAAQPSPPSTRTAPAARKVKAAPLPLGSVEFRIRPYAAIYLDGKLLGETPMGIVDLPAKKYVVTAVNRDLDKRVTRDFEVKAGTANVFKLNLLAD